MLPHWKSDFVNVDGVKVHYVRTGDGNKPALVLAHGFSDNGLCWLPVARDLEDEYDVILPDAHGHGLSERINPEQPADMPGELAGFIGVLGLVRPVVGGHSMGANSAARMGARFPELARAIVLEDPPWRMMEPPAPAEKDATPRPNPFAEWVKGFQTKTVDEIIAEGRKQSPNWPEVEWQPWGESKKQLDPNVTLRRPMQGEPTWQETAAAIRVPVLLMTADVAKGAIVSAENAAEAKRLNPLIEVARIDGAGHSIRRENFADYMIALRAFLNKVK